MASEPYVYDVGVVGYGTSAKTFHIPFIEASPEFKLWAVVQRNPKPEDDAKRDHPGIQSYRSVEELARDPVVDVVVVTTPPDTHFGIVKLVLEARIDGELSSVTAIAQAWLSVINN